MNMKKKIIILVAVIAAVGIAAGSFTILKRANNITNSVEQMKQKAEDFYRKGDLSKAIYQMAMYCENNDADAEAVVKLGDWYGESGDDNNAQKSYKKAIDILAEADDTSIYANSGAKAPDNNGFTIEISPAVRYTKNMKLVFTGENITPAKTADGKVDSNTPKLKNTDSYKTTGWFYVSPQMKNLTLSGDFNTAIWQFQTFNDDYLVQNNNLNYKKNQSVRFDNNSYDTVSVPDKTFRARVTYFDKEITDSEAKGKDILITAGKIPDGYTDYKNQVFSIPDLSQGDSVTFADGEWKLKTTDGEKKLNLDAPVIGKGMYCYVVGDLCGKVKINYKKADEAAVGDKSKIYGVKFSNVGTVSSCERKNDSAGMNFDYKIGSEWALGTGNDFDKAYPWCDMKLCAVTEDSDGKKQVVYSDEKEFAADGSKGNVMVEIPKFYIRRVVSDRAEAIYVSGMRHEGFSVEPVFRDSNGDELDKVYVSAYFGSEQDGKIVSKSNAYPVLMLKYKQTLDMARQNGGGFSEMSFSMVSALQKLFLVETGTIDSSSIIAGDTFKYYFTESDSKEKSGYAYESDEKTNSIKVYRTIGTEKITEGSDIVIFDGWDDYSNAKSVKRGVTAVSQNEEYIKIEFDGDPINVNKDKTAVSNIPEKTGKTESIDYCTGTLNGETGKVSFKYRNIENLYGSALVMLDNDAYVKDKRLYIETGDDTISVNDDIVVQDKDLSDYTDVNTNECVRKMTFDSSYPSAMLPSAVGGGASSLSGYGDFWQYTGAKNTQYNLCYGGADDNARIAGVFQLRALFMGERYRIGFVSARIMYK